MQRKKKICEGCGQEKYIWSNKKCKTCSQSRNKKPLRGTTAKSREKRKQLRSCLSEFFKKHITLVNQQRLCCENCGNKLSGHVSEIAHILPKSYYKNIMCDDSNVLYLCGMYSDSQCHYAYDNVSNRLFQELSVFEKAKQKVIKLIESGTQLTHKDYVRYNINI